VNRIDKPHIDTDEQYVYFNSPAIGVMASGTAYHTELAFGWAAQNPFTLEMCITLTSGSVVVNEYEFPHGLVCMKCLLPIQNGSIACAINEDELHDAIWCIACGRDHIEVLQEETWYISLDHVREALADRADYDPGNGDVRITRPTTDSLLFRLGRWPNEYMFLNIPLSRVQTFVESIDQYVDDSDREAVRAAYLDHGLGEIEKLLGGYDA
jgi:hypothetical protein